MTYELGSELFGHHKEARSIAFLGRQDGHISFVTGSNDSVLQIWRSADNGKTFDLFKTEYSHSKPIYSIAVLIGFRGFVTACADKNLRLFDINGEIISALMAHDSPIGSVCVSKNGQVISGDWGGVVKVWNLSQDLKTMNCIATLPGHENSVCVVALPNGTIATGSAGIRGQGRVDHSKVRIWKDERVVSTITQHDGPVRGLFLHPNGLSFFSCSNDGSIVQYGLDGGVLSRFQNPVGYENMPGFIYNVTVNSDDTVVAACDDYCARVFSVGSQSFGVLPHPNYVWATCFLDNGDIATACADSVVRVFTQNSDRMSPVEVRKGYVKRCDEVVQEVLKKQMKQQQLNPNHYQAFEERSPGTKHGEAKLFRRDGKLWYYTWDTTKLDWELVGECQGVVKDNKIDGVEYDDVIDIEVEAPTGGVRALKLGINKGQNPYVVATEFCKRNNIDLDQVHKIVEHVQMEQNRSGARAFSMQTPTAQKEGTIKNVAFRLPSSAGFVLEKFKLGALSKMLNKIQEFNDEVPKTAKLSDTDIMELKELVSTLEDTSRYHVSALDSGVPQLFQKVLTNWDVQHIFPVLDLLRLTLVHPHAKEVFNDDNLKEVVKDAMKFVSPNKFSSEKIRVAVSLTGTRVLTNCFKSQIGVAACTSLATNPDSFEKVILPLEKVAQVNSKAVRETVAIACLNISNALSHAGKINPDCNFLFMKLITETILPIALKGNEKGTALNSLRALAIIFSDKLQKKEKLLPEETVWKGEVLQLLTDTKESFQAYDRDIINKVIRLLSNF